MEVVTLGFPLYQIWKHTKATRETALALEAFDQKQLKNVDASLGSDSVRSRSTRSSRKGMYPMESLDECLASDSNGLQVYASSMELNGDNIIFLTSVLAFQRSCQQAFASTCKSTADFRRARATMFRAGLGIFVSLVHTGTASYPINIESPIYNRLNHIFGEATASIASVNIRRTPSLSASSSANITPWDNHSESDDTASSETHFPMQPLAGDESSIPPSTLGRNDSSEHIVNATGSDDASIKVPVDFDERVFDAAFKSVRYMVWTETWQRYMAWKRTSGSNIEVNG